MLPWSQAILYFAANDRKSVPE